MNKLRYLRPSRKNSFVIAGILFRCAIWQLGPNLLEKSSGAAHLNENEALLDGYRHVEVASVYDALEPKILVAQDAAVCAMLEIILYCHQCSKVEPATTLAPSIRR